MKQKISIYTVDTVYSMPVTFVEEGVRAGFPSPAQDYVTRPIDLNQVLVKDPASTFVLQADEDFAPEAGFFSGDILIFDRPIRPRRTDMIAYPVDGEFYLSRNDLSKSLEDAVVWGVLTARIKINRNTISQRVVPEILSEEELSKLRLPYLVQERVLGKIDLNKLLIKNPPSTFITIANGDSMKNDYIDDKDLLIVDKLLDHYDGCLAVCYIDGEFTLKRVKVEKEIAWLVPANPAYPRIRITADNDLRVWGIVTSVIKRWRA